MRRSILGLSLFSLVFLGSQGVFAQKVIDKDQINERIKELRNRLKQYQTSVRVASEKEEIKLERISEELETRQDVAVTVLFHDGEVKEDQESVEKLSSEHLFEDDVNVKPEPISVMVENTQFQRLDEMKKRQELFDSLRAKVQQATRRSHESARMINGLVAQIPEQK